MVSLTSSDPGAVIQPPGVNVDEGSWSTHFSLTRATSSTTSSTMNLTATYGGSSLSTVISKIVPAPPPVPPAITIQSGIQFLGAQQQATETITLASPAPSNGAVVTLLSSDPAAIAVPAQIVVPGGSTTKTFTITNQYSGTPKQVDITATYSGTSATDSFYVPKAPGNTGCAHRRTCPRGFFWNEDTCQCEAQ